MSSANAPIDFISARKIWPLLKTLGKLNDFSLPRAGKIFATARMLGFLLKHAELKYGTTENIGNTYALYD